MSLDLQVLDLSFVFLCLDCLVLAAAVQVLPQLLHLSHVLPLVAEKLSELLGDLLHSLFFQGELLAQRLNQRVVQAFLHLRGL